MNRPKNGSSEHALLRRSEVNIGGEWFIEEVWDATHPHCPYVVCEARRFAWQRKVTSALMITRRIPMPALHPLYRAKGHELTAAPDA